VLGVVEFFSREIRAPDAALLKVVETIGQQIGQFCERRRAEHDLRESELRKSAMLEAALDCIIIIDHRDRILEWNPAAEKTFGRSRAEVLGQSMSELIVPPAWRQKHQQALKRYLQTGNATLLGRRVEMIAMHANGTEFPVELALTEVSVEGPPIFMAYLRDITERRQAEASLRASEAEFRAVFELAGSGKCQTDPATGRFLRVNRKLSEITGYSREELLNVTFSDITHSDDREKDLKQFERLAAGEVAEYSMEKRYIRKDGKATWVHVTTTLIRDALGRPLRTVGVVQDIDYRKRMEQALRESEERYRLILENALEFAIFTLDKEGLVTTWNPGAQRILGFEEQEIVGRRLDIIFTEEDRKNGLLDIEMGRALTQGKAQDERWHLRKDGSPFWATGLMMPLNDENGQHLGFLKILRDRTARKQAEQALRETEARFRQLADAMPQIVWSARADVPWTTITSVVRFTGLPEDQPVEPDGSSCSTARTLGAG
jgi:PAS domain S-box-containing protein